MCKDCVQAVDTSGKLPDATWSYEHQPVCSCTVLGVSEPLSPTYSWTFPTLVHMLRRVISSVNPELSTLSTPLTTTTTTYIHINLGKALYA